MKMNVSWIVWADLLWQVGSSNEFEERVDPTDGMAEASLSEEIQKPNPNPARKSLEQKREGLSTSLRDETNTLWCSTTHEPTP